jgi:predicted transcriptional regulator
MAGRRHASNAHGLLDGRRFGRNLAAARGHARLTQEELSDLSGVHPTEVSRIENGQRDVRISTVAEAIMVGVRVEKHPRSVQESTWAIGICLRAGIVVCGGEGSR